MTRRSLLTLGVCLGIPFAISAFETDTFPASGGDIRITPITHASVQLEYGGIVVQADPWSSGDYTRAKAADLILITGVENDHLDLNAIQKIRKPETRIVIPAAARDKVPDGIVMENGDTKDVAGVRVESIASYDLIPGEPFHPKGRGNGYVITLGGKRIYLSGVTVCVPEVQALKNIDVAFVSMNLPHGRMTPSAAARLCCRVQSKGRVPVPLPLRKCGGVQSRSAGNGGQCTSGGLVSRKVEINCRRDVPQRRNND